MATGGGHGVDSGEASPLDEMCDELLPLYDKLYDARTKWFDIGLNLNINNDDLSAINVLNSKPPEICLREMLTERLHSGGPLSWRDVCDCLRSSTVKRNDVAEKIEEWRIGMMSKKQSKFPSPLSETGLIGSDCSSLDDQVKHLEEIFNLLTNEGYRRIKKSGISVEDFYAIITSMSVSLKHIAGNYVEECFEKANTLAKMWGKLNQFWDFLNYELFQHVVRVMFTEAGDPLLRKLAEYESERETFLNETKLCDFVDHWPFLIAKPKKRSIVKLKRIVVKVCKEWKDCTLYDVKTTNKLFSKGFSLPQEFMLVAGGIKSSVSIILYVPPSLAYSIEEQVKQGKEFNFLADNGFLSITIDGIQVYPLRQASLQDDLNVKELPPDSASKSPTASQPHAAACKTEGMQMFCTTGDEKLEQVDPADASNIPIDAQGGVARYHLLWDVEQIPKLKIHFLNDDILEDEHWKCGHAGPLTVDTILAWAAVWNSHADNYPQIAEGLATKEKAHIRVEFRRKGISWSKVGTAATWETDKKKPTMVLNLYGMAKADQRSMVIHEFGHVLGLDHEHQRSDFWDVLESKDEDEEYRFIIGKRRMKSGDGGRCQRACDAVFRAKLKEPSGRKESCYDSDSIMHYWFDKNWLLPEYQESANVAKVKNERERKVLLGVHKRDHNNGNLAENPSKLDYETLNRAYEIPSGLPPPDAAAAPPTVTTAKYTKPEEDQPTKPKVQTEPTAAQLNQQCSNDALLQLSTKIADYNGFKVRLGLSDAEINAIDLTISDIPGRFYTALKRWKSKGMFDSTATYGRLMEIAKKKEDGEAFQSILSACIEHASP